MAEALKGIYNRRHPERIDYYSPIEAFEDRRIIEGNFEEFERSYPDQFEEKYGYLRTEAMKAIYSFTETSSAQVWSVASQRTEWRGCDVRNAVMTFL